MRIKFISAPKTGETTTDIELNRDDIERLLDGETLDNADVQISADAEAQRMFVNCICGEQRIDSPANDENWIAEHGSPGLIIKT